MKVIVGEDHIEGPASRSHSSLYTLYMLFLCDCFPVMAAKVTESESQVTDVQTRLTATESQVTNQQTRLNATEVQVGDLEKQSEGNLIVQGVECPSKLFRCLHAS